MTNPTDRPDFRDMVMTAAGLRDARNSVFKLIHVEWPDDLAWHDEDGWTQYRRGRVFTYEEASQIEAARDTTTGTPIGQRKVPDEGRWYWHGYRINLYEKEMANGMVHS
jgi:hypothetical protein